MSHSLINNVLIITRKQSDAMEDILHFEVKKEPYPSRSDGFNKIEISRGALFSLWESGDRSISTWIDLKDVVRTVQKGAAFKYGLKLSYAEALQTLKHPVFDDEETATERRSNPDP
jgi:hypothetical protein